MTTCDPFQRASGEVHTWCIALDAAPHAYARLQASLTDDERSRSARFRFERDRRRFAIAHGALREILGGYLGMAPGQVALVHNAFGKPALSPALEPGLTFNLSHSGDLALIGIAEGAEIGVDLEYILARRDYADVAQRFFSAAEVEHLDGLEASVRTQAFYDLWTQKEAYLKACGEGLAGLEDEVHDPAPARHWSLHTLDPAPGYVGAVAIEGSGWRLAERRWQEDSCYA